MAWRCDATTGDRAVASVAAARLGRARAADCPAPLGWGRGGQGHVVGSVPAGPDHTHSQVGPLHILGEPMAHILGEPMAHQGCYVVVCTEPSRARPHTEGSPSGARPHTAYYIAIRSALSTELSSARPHTACNTAILQAGPDPAVLQRRRAGPGALMFCMWWCFPCRFTVGANQPQFLNQF